jgi:predicted TIM-barrel fold metal-dependent hydrolase
VTAIIDGHCHVWPDAVAEKALAAPMKELRRFGDGKVSTLLSTMEVAGIDRAVCLGIANTPDRVEAANRFAASLDSARLIGFGSIHVDLSLDENLKSLRRHGLRGVKVHPLFQGYSLDDPRLFALLERMQGEFVVVIHVGKGGDGSERCTPQMLRKLARALPGLELVACHFGGYHLLDEAEATVIGLPNVYLDTSWPPGLGSVDPTRVRAVIERHGVDRVLFASDWPMADPGADIAAVRALDLPDEDTAAILGGNLERLLRRPAAP